MANTNKVKRSELKSLWQMADNHVYKQNRILTRHYIPLTLTLPADSLKLLTWLIYQSNADNTFIYSTALLRRYKLSIQAADDLHLTNTFNPSLITLRTIIQNLIERGLLINLPNTPRPTYFILPTLTYHPIFVSHTKHHELIAVPYLKLLHLQTQTNKIHRADSKTFKAHQTHTLNLLHSIIKSYRSHINEQIKSKAGTNKNQFTTQKQKTIYNH